MTNDDDLNVTSSLRRAQQETAPFLPGESSAVQTILCVSEDPAVAQREIVPVLKKAGYEVELVEPNPRKPLDTGSKSYAVVLFDVARPNGAGYAVCQQTRSHSGLPMMLVLRGAARADVLHAYEAGADAHVLSPFDPRELLARMQALLRRQPLRPPWL